MAIFDLETIRHSSAHLMAQAIERLWPESKVQFGIGPTIENGFYYDVDMEHRLSEEDLKKIEKKNERDHQREASRRKKSFRKRRGH